MTASANLLESRRMTNDLRDLEAVVGACRRLGLDASLCNDIDALQADLKTRRTGRPDLAGLAELLSARLRNLNAAAFAELKKKLLS